MKKLYLIIFIVLGYTQNLVYAQPKITHVGEYKRSQFNKLFAGGFSVKYVFTDSSGYFSITIPTVYFNVPIKKGKGNVILKQNNVEVFRMNIDTIDKSVSGGLSGSQRFPFLAEYGFDDVFDYNPALSMYSSVLNMYSTIKIIFEAGIVEDKVTGVPFAGDSVTIRMMDRNNNYNLLKEASRIPRSILGYGLYFKETIPSQGAANVSLVDPLVFKMNYPLVKKTGAGNFARIFENGKLTHFFDVKSDSVIVSGDKVTLLHKPFKKNASITVSFYYGGEYIQTVDTFNYIGNKPYVQGASPANFYSSVNGLLEGADVIKLYFTTTSDDTAPVITTYSPADNSKDIAYTAPVSITFNEPIEKGVGNIVIKENGVVKQTIAVTDAGVTLVGTTLTIPHTPFSNKAEVSIQLDKGIVKDLAGSPYAGIKDDMTWNFSIVDVTAVTDLIVTAFSPVDNATNVSANPIVTMTFNRDVEKGAGNITIKENALVKKVINVMDPSVMISGKVVTVDHGLTFKASANVSITVDAGTFKDMAGKTYAGFTDPSKWNFKINSIGTPIAADPVKGEESLLSTTGIEIFPVPSSDKITINLTDPNMEVSHVKVTDLSGKVVYEKSVSIKATDAKAIEIEAKNYNKGIYILQVSTNQGTKTKRVVLE